MTKLTYTRNEVEELMSIESKFTAAETLQDLELTKALAKEQGKLEEFNRLLPIITEFALDALKHRTKMADVKQLLKELES